MKSSTKRFALGTLIAAVAGYLAGILTAPKSGKETREDIKNTTVKTVHEAEKQLKKLHTELSDLLGKAKEQAANLSGKAKIEFDNVVASTTKVKEKARELLSGMHEGEVEDKDLQKAIDDATKAINNLKTYLKK